MNAMRRRGWAFALPLIAAALPTAAQAAGPCYPRGAMMAHLAERYGEHPVATGVAQGHLVLLLARPDGASWTILLLPPNSDGRGIACPLAAGEGWRTLAAPEPETPSATPESPS
jgi:hypothetical protein